MTRSIYILTYLILFVTVSFSQSKAKTNILFAKEGQINLKNLRAYKNTIASSKATTIQSNWFNYGLNMLPSQGFNCPSTWGVYIFPDTSAYLDLVTSVVPIKIHQMAEIVDFRSPAFYNDPLVNWIGLNPSAPLKVDSLSIVYGYKRIQTNITDTLIVTFFDGSLTANGNFETANTLNINGLQPLGVTDTLFYKKVGYNQSSNTIAAASNTATLPSGQIVFKILLTSADTAITYFREKSFPLPTPFISDGNRLFCSNIEFKPGYTYSVTEQICTTANSFMLCSLEEDGSCGTNNYPMWAPSCGSGWCEYSQSYLLTSEIKYNQANLNNGSFLPSILYSPAIPAEHHLISFHISNDMANICQANALFSVAADTINPGVYNGYNNCTGIGTFSYLWDFGDGTTSTLQYPSHQYSVPGQYVICLTLSTTSGTATCTDTYCDSSSVQKMAAGFLMNQFNVIAPIITNINQTEKSIDIKAYPNPISDELVIEFTNKDFEKLNYVLIDALGRFVLSNSFEKDKTIINTSQLSKGFYHLNIINADGIKIKSLKIIK